MNFNRKSKCGLLTLPVLLILFSGCGASDTYYSDEPPTDEVDTSELSDETLSGISYFAFKEAWDDYSLEDQVGICLAIDDDPSIIFDNSDTVDDALLVQEFFDDVCP